MKTTHRNYCEEAGDFYRLAEFITANHQMVRQRSTWCLGRFVDWKYGLWGTKFTTGGFCDQNAHIWFDGYNQIAGFAISESGEPEFAILTLDGYRFLYEEMLDWGLDAWGGRGPHVTTEITEHQAIEARVLERRGFTRQSTFYTRTFDLTGELVARYPLEDGFKIVDMQAHPDYRGQRILRYDAFQSAVYASEEEIQRDVLLASYAHQGPLYHAATDLCVMAPDGQLVAGCEALIDGRNCEADIERVCTHSAFRKRGFARAVIQECLYRLKEMGIARASITGYSQAAIALYGSLGADLEMKSYVYEK